MNRRVRIYSIFLMAAILIVLIGCSVKSDIDSEKRDKLVKLGAEVSILQEESDQIRWDIEQLSLPTEGELELQKLRLEIDSLELALEDCLQN